MALEQLGDYPQMVITSHNLLNDDGEEAEKPTGHAEEPMKEEYMKRLEGDEREIMRLVTQKTRANLIQDMIGHPKESVALAEFDYMNPSKQKATINEHLNRLESSGVVRKRELSDSQRSRDLPYTFYELSSAGRAFLEDHQILIDDEEEIKDQYSRVRKEPEIQEIEEAPRP